MLKTKRKLKLHVRHFLNELCLFSWCKVDLCDLLIRTTVIFTENNPTTSSHRMMTKKLQDNKRAEILNFHRVELNAAVVSSVFCSLFAMFTRFSTFVLIEGVVLDLNFPQSIDKLLICGFYENMLNILSEQSMKDRYFRAKGRIIERSCRASKCYTF